jgi:hypothetical protein
MLTPSAWELWPFFVRFSAARSVLSRPARFSYGYLADSPTPICAVREFTNYIYLLFLAAPIDFSRRLARVLVDEDSSVLNRERAWSQVPEPTRPFPDIFSNGGCMPLASTAVYHSSAMQRDIPEHQEFQY